MLLILAFVLLFLLPDPWNWIGFGTCAVLFGGELAFWNRTVRGRRPQVGAETLIGARGVTATPCRPDGQVRVEGALWAARCRTEADEGTPVTVVGRDELTLIVEPAGTPGPAGGG
jgi:membrane protein implicated in regulation of membrane protease activity